MSKKTSARLRELAPSSVASSHNLADIFLDNPVHKYFIGVRKHETLFDKIKCWTSDFEFFIHLLLRRKEGTCMPHILSISGGKQYRALEYGSLQNPNEYVMIWEICILTYIELNIF